MSSVERRGSAALALIAFASLAGSAPGRGSASTGQLRFSGRPCGGRLTRGRPAVFIMLLRREPVQWHIRRLPTRMSVRP